MVKCCFCGEIIDTKADKFDNFFRTFSHKKCSDDNFENMEDKIYYL